MRIDQDDPAVLNAYLDGELPAEEAEKIRAHVMSCPICGQELPRLQRMKDLLREKVQVPPAPPALKSRIRMEISQKGERPAWREALVANLRAPAWGALAVMVLLMVTGWGYYQWRYLPRIIAQDMAERHLKCSGGPIHDFQEITEVNALESWYKNNLAYRVSLPRFGDERVSLMGGKRCRLGGMHIAHTVYTEGDKRISLFALPQGTCSLRAFKKLPGFLELYHTSTGKVDIILWRKGNLIYALAFEGELSRIKSLAESTL